MTTTHTRSPAEGLDVCGFGTTSVETLLADDGDPSGDLVRLHLPSLELARQDDLGVHRMDLLPDEAEALGVLLIKGAARARPLRQAVPADG